MRITDKDYYDILEVLKEGGTVRDVTAALCKPNSYFSSVIFRMKKRGWLSDYKVNINGKITSILTSVQGAEKEIEALFYNKNQASRLYEEKIKKKENKKIEKEYEENKKYEPNKAITVVGNVTTVKGLDGYHSGKIDRVSKKNYARGHSYNY